MSTIGYKIRKLRITNNLSQPELSNLLGISQPTLCNIESGDRKKIDFCLIQKICVVFNKDLNYFKEDPNCLDPNLNENQTECNEVVTGAISIIVDQVRLLVQDIKTKSEIIQDLENRLKSNK